MLKNVVEVELQVTSNFIEWVFVTFENLDCHHIYDILSAKFYLQVLFSKKNVFYLRKEMEIYIIILIHWTIFILSSELPASFMMWGSDSWNRGSDLAVWPVPGNRVGVYIPQSKHHLYYAS